MKYSEGITGIKYRDNCCYTQIKRETDIANKLYINGLSEKWHWMRHDKFCDILREIRGNKI